MVNRMQSLKTNPVFWAGAAALVYGVIAILVAGLSLKAMVAVGIGGFIVLQMAAPVLFSKLKSKLVDFVKNAIDNPGDTIVNIIGDSPQPTEYKTATLKEVLAEKIITGEHQEAFKDDEHDAIAKLAYSAKKAKNEKALEQLKAVNNEFFDISLSRVEGTDEKTV